MQRIKLMKPVDHAQLGHLYEHLFCTSLVDYLREKGLYAYLDYFISARAYYCGIVEVNLELYTAEAKKVADAVPALEPDFTDDAVSGALIQILAEKRADVQHADLQIVLKKLRQYQATPWQPFDDLAIRNAADHKKSRRGLELTSRNHRHFMILRQDITLDTDFANRDKLTYWPLFYVLSTFLNKNLQEDIPGNLYCYTYDDFGRYSPQLVKETNLYRVDKRQASKLTCEVEVARDLVKKMIEGDCTAKLANFLQSTSSSVPFLSPDSEELYRRAAILIGAAGWRRIGSEENISNTLKHMSITFSLGKTNDKLNLAELI
jgi:hypothetical protein